MRPCGPTPSASAPSRNCAAPNSARPRSSSRCRWCFTSNPTTAPARPTLCQRRLRGDHRLLASKKSSIIPNVGGAAPSRGSRARSRGARAGRKTGRSAVEYRWQCADGNYKHFLDQAVLLQGRGRTSGRVRRNVDRRYRAAIARKPVDPGAEDGRDRQADRRDRARFQQSARGGDRRARPARTSARRSTRSSAGSRR